MNGPKFNCHVAVFFPGNFFSGKPDAASETCVRFVTSEEGSTVLWEDGKPAKLYTAQWARDTVYGLTLNGWAAAVIQVLDGVQLSNPPAPKD